MPDTKLRPTSTMYSKDKSSKQRFGHVNARNRKSYIEYHFLSSYIISKKNFQKTKIQIFENFRFLETFYKPRFLKPTSTALVLVLGLG